MNRALVMTAAIATVFGVAHATPALARDRPVDRNIPCEPPPPTSDVVNSRQGGLALQLPGFGVSGDRGRATSRTDVIITAEGRDGYFDLDLYAKACHTIRLTWPNNPARQLEEMVRFRERLRRPEADVAEASITDNAGFQSLFETRLGPPEGQAASGQPAVTATPAPAPVPAPITIDVTSPTRSYRSPTCSDASCRGTRQPSGAGSAHSNAAPNPDCDGDTTCGHTIVSGGLVVPGRVPVTVRTCTTSAPVTMPGMAIQVGNLILPGMPITISNGETTCTTSGSF